MSAWIVIIGAVVASFVLRYATVTLTDRFSLPGWLEGWDL